MTIETSFCTSFKGDLRTATHDFTPLTGDVFKLALYQSTAVLNASTAIYTSLNEVVGIGYAPGGIVLNSILPEISGPTKIIDFEDFVFPASTITANGCLIYNATASNKAVSVHAFGSDRSSNNDDFNIIFPDPDAFNAIIRFA